MKEKGVSWWKQKKKNSNEESNAMNDVTWRAVRLTPAFCSLNENPTLTPARPAGVRTSVFIWCGILAGRPHVWLIVVIISQGDGWAAGGTIAVNHCGRSGHSGAAHGPAVWVWRERLGLWRCLDVGDSRRYISPAQLDVQPREEAVTPGVPGGVGGAQCGGLCCAPMAIYLH